MCTGAIISTDKDRGRWEGSERAGMEGPRRVTSDTPGHMNTVGGGVKEGWWQAVWPGSTFLKYL